MNFLTDYRGDEPDFQLPRLVYARVDRVEPVAGEDHRVVLLDAVDAEWFLEFGRGFRSLADANIVDRADERVSVLETWLEPDEEHLGRPAGEEWLEIELDEPGTGRAVRHYPNLFAAPVERAITRVDPPPAFIEPHLTATMGLADFADASSEDIEDILRQITPSDAAAVYDVGQGNCNALLRGSIPLLYFDFGGGVLQNATTFPTALDNFCLTSSPPIVLSHWDWDHWSSANRDTRALDQAWIVPRHNNILGPVHTTFLGKLQRRGRVLIWPHGVSSISSGGLQLVACTGSTRQRNNSGLALIYEAQGYGHGASLLPGDAAYNHIPYSNRHYTHLVVPHHGGPTRAASVPGSDDQACARLVYSYGPNNSYGHPFASTVQDHDPLWGLGLRTATRDTSGLGHVHLYWNDRAPDAHPPCGGIQCELTCHQR